MTTLSPVYVPFTYIDLTTNHKALRCLGHQVPGVFRGYYSWGEGSTDCTVHVKEIEPKALWPCHQCEQTYIQQKHWLRFVPWRPAGSWPDR